MPEVHRNAPRPGAPAFRPTADTPAIGPPPEPAPFPEASEIYGITQPVEAIWPPAAAEAPGIFTDPAGRRRIRVRWLAAGAGLLAGGVLVVEAVGLLGGPQAPLLPWTRPHAQPGSGSALATHRQPDPAHHRAAHEVPALTPQVRAGGQPTQPPSTVAASHGTAAPQGTAATSSQHTPPGLAHKPTKSHPAVP